MPSNRKLKLQARRQASTNAALKERVAGPCAYCDGTGKAPDSDGRTPCGFCGADR